MNDLKRYSRERETILGMGNRDSDQMRFVQLQYDNVKQESARVDEQITSSNQQCKQYQNQMEVSTLSRCQEEK